MSLKVPIIRAKPNPSGKDVYASGAAREDQLLGEWVDLKNIGNTVISLPLVHLCHTEFNQSCSPTTKYQKYWSGNYGELLEPGQIVRVHTGKRAYASLMNAEDRAGVSLHAYADRGTFVLNNKCGDLISVWRDPKNWTIVDKAYYEPYPPEGAILKRSGDKLVPQYSYI